MFSLTRINLLDTDVLQHHKVIPKENIKASRTADQIIQDAISYSNKVHNEADTQYQNRTEQGYQEGKKQWEIEQAERITQLNLQIKQHLMNSKSDVTDMIMSIVEKVIGQIDQAQLISKLVSQSLNQLSLDCSIDLRVSPENIEQAKQACKQLLDQYPSIETLNVIMDTKLSALEFLIEHPIGIHDISPKTQFNNLKKSLNES